MPPVIAAVADYVATFVAYAATAVGGTSLVYAAAYTVAYYAVEAAIYYGLSRALTPSSRTPSIRSQSTQIIVQGTSESQRIIYGQIQCAGLFYPLGSTGTNNEYFHYLVVYAAHECDSFGELNVNGEAASLDTSGNVTTGKYAGLMTVKSHLGAWNQTVDTDIQAAFGTSFWPDTACLKGHAYDYIRITYDKNIAGGGVPNITRMIKGRKVYDPRDATQNSADPTTWKWSNNSALCNADWVAGVPMLNGAGNVIQKFGFRAAWSEISSADLIESANICDESITITGGTEPRFTCNGLVTVSSTRADVQDALRSSMVGDVVFIGGQWIIRAAAYRTPNTTTLNEDDFRAGISNLQVKPARANTINGVKGTYIAPENNWQAADAPAYTKQIPAANLVAGDNVMIVVAGSTTWTAIGAPNNNVGTIFTATGPGTGTGYAEAYIVQDGGDRLWLDVELPFTTSPATAQRIFKIHLEMARQTIKFVAHCKLTALQHQPTDNVQLSFARYGWSNKIFRVEGFQPIVESGAQGTPLVGCDLSLVETASTIYDWDPSEEKAVDTAPNTTLPDPFTVAAPTGLALTSTSFRQPEGVLMPQLQVAWTSPADQFVLSGGKIRIQYKKHADSSWIDWNLSDGASTVAVINGLLVGTAYDVQIRAENQIGAASAWVQSLDFTLTLDTTPPPAPTGLAAVAGTGKVVTLTWNAIDIVATPDFARRYAVYRNTTNSFSGATKLAGDHSSTKFVDATVVLGTTYYYFVTAFDQSENESAASSSASATPTGVATGGTVLAPTAATKTSDGSYISGDGNAFAYIEVSLPAIPANAVGQYLLYRRSGDTQWMIAGDFANAVTATGVRVPDLTPGQAYEFATQAYNSFGDMSTVVAATGSPFTAPIPASGPAAPTGISYTAGNASAFKSGPRYSGAVLMYSMLATWTASTAKQVAYYNWRLVQTDSSGGTIWTSGITSDIQAVVSMGLQVVGYFYIQAIDRSGVAGPWTGGGTQISTYLQPPAGDMSNQNANAVQTSGIQTGASGATSVEQVIAKMPLNTGVVPSLVGGSTEETVNLDLTNRGFSTKPDGATGLVVASSKDMKVRYDYDDAGSTSTNAVLKVSRFDGGTLAAGPVRITGELYELN